MSWQVLVPVVTGSLLTFLGLMARLAYRLHMDAINAEKGRADDNRARAEAAERRADLREEQIGILLGRGLPPQQG